MSDDATLDDHFPSIQEITDPNLRDAVRDTWAQAIAESNFEDLSAVPWWPPHEERVGSLSLVEHVNDVVRCAIALTDGLDTQSLGESGIRRDDVVAGALLHDVSKVFEIEDGRLVEDHDLLPHPHYAVHLLAANGLSTHLQHVVLAHTDRSGVEPRTLAARIVSIADELVVDAIYWSSTGRLKTHAAED